MHCVFCEIIARKSPATIHYEDDEYIVFSNVLKWAPIMLLVVPKVHKTQKELWSDVGRAGAIALEMGEKFCAGGFRLLSNLGHDAMQSQDHGHIHIIGGAFLGRYA